MKMKFSIYMYLNNIRISSNSLENVMFEKETEYIDHQPEVFVFLLYSNFNTYELKTQKETLTCKIDHFKHRNVPLQWYMCSTIYALSKRLRLIQQNVMHHGVGLLGCGTSETLSPDCIKMSILIICVVTSDVSHLSLDNRCCFSMGFISGQFGWPIKHGD